MINDPAIKSSTDKLLFELMKHELSEFPESIRAFVEKVTDLIRINAYNLAENMR